LAYDIPEKMSTKSSPNTEKNLNFPAPLLDVASSSFVGESQGSASPGTPIRNVLTHEKRKSETLLKPEVVNDSMPMYPLSALLPTKEDVVIPIDTQPRAEEKSRSCHDAMRLQGTGGVILITGMTLFIGAIVAVAVYFLANIPSPSGQQAIFQNNLRNLCLQRAQQIEIEVAQLTAAMLDLKAYVETQVTPSSTDFLLFANKSSISRTPAFSVSYCTRLLASQRQAWEEQNGVEVSSGFYPNGSHIPRTNESLYYPIQFRWVPERFSASNAANLLGLDYLGPPSGSFPSVRAINQQTMSLSSVTYAISLNNLVALVIASPVVIPTNDSRNLVTISLAPPQPGNKAFTNLTSLEVYNDTSVPVVLAGAFLVQSLFEDALKRFPNPTTRIIITDATPNGEGFGAVIFDYTPTNESYATDHEVRITVPILDRIWTYMCVATASDYRATQTATATIIIVTCCMAVGFLLIALLLGLLGGTWTVDGNLKWLFRVPWNGCNKTLQPFFEPLLIPLLRCPV
jgi:hypothetical protein